MLIDYTKDYTAADLNAFINAARERSFWASTPFRMSCSATGYDRAQALEAWQRVAELAAWLELHAEDDEARQAAQDARQLAEEQRRRLASLPMADDARIDDATRREVIAATEGTHWRRLPASIRAAIAGKYVPSAQDLDDNPIDRLEADVLALKPALITCKPRNVEQEFELEV